MLFVAVDVWMKTVLLIFETNFDQNSLWTSKERGVVVVVEVEVVVM